MIRVDEAVKCLCFDARYSPEWRARLLSMWGADQIGYADLIEGPITSPADVARAAEGLEILLRAESVPVGLQRAIADEMVADCLSRYCMGEDVPAAVAQWAKDWCGGSPTARAVGRVNQAHHAARSWAAGTRLSPRWRAVLAVDLAKIVAYGHLTEDGTPLRAYPSAVANAAASEGIRWKVEIARKVLAKRG